MKTYLQQIDLPNGLSISVHDTTRRYYEDYHLVRLEFLCRVPLRVEYFEDTEAFHEAENLLGEAAVYRRTCEKMGVPFDGIGAARDTLITDFMKNSLPYFIRESFPRKLVLSEVVRAREKTIRVRM
jgi:hypothetical protein